MIAQIKNIQTTYLWRDNLLLTAVKLQMFNGKTRMSDTLLEHVFFLSLFHA